MTPSADMADSSVPSSGAIQAQMERILNSPEFNATHAQKEFLQFVIGKTLAGDADEVKGYTVATQVFGRGENFDQATDPIVSIQANKLRRALERYYLVAGQNDAVRIDIPKGTYVPVFQQLGGRRPGEGSPAPPKTAPCATSAWPTILIQSFENLTGSPELAYIGIGIATEIALEITRYQEVRVLRQRTGGRQRRASDVAARFALCGSVKQDVTGLKVIVYLVDQVTGLHIWGDSHQADLEPARLISFMEGVAATVVGKISCEDGVIARTLSSEARKVPPAERTTYQAMLRFYQFLNDFTEETFFDTFGALQQACQNEPECGLAWSMLARLYAVNHSMELFDLETPIETAAAFAERGVWLDPANQRVRLIMAFVMLFQNELPAGLAEAQKTLQLNPNSLIFLENIGHVMTLLGEWQRGPALIRKAMQLNPHYNIIVHYSLWVDWVRQDAYAHAYEETLHFRTPTLFWDPLMKAATLGLLGRAEEGRQAGRDLLRCKPDFAKRGRALIGPYIKFADIRARVIEGLKEAGVDLE